MKRMMLIAIVMMAVTALATSAAVAQHHRHSGVQISVNLGGHGCVHTYRPPVCVHTPVVVRPPIYAPSYPIYPHSASSVARANARMIHNLHDAHNDQERALRDLHRAQRERLEHQIRMMPAGSHARDQLKRQLIDLRRQQAAAEDRLDDYNDAQRRQLHRMTRR